MFTLLDTTPFPQRRVNAKRFRHDCGLEVLSLEADDNENLFAIVFGTEPVDDTGVAHIIEHSVLEGSERFPVKDPFVCMLKTSVATFINAMTYPDRTIYPCTTCNRKDYFNLFEVYWDAVFHPRLSPEIFGQEGWHYEVHGSASKPELKCNGIVLNEMSGYYSDPTTILGRAMEKSLYGHTPMRYDSGGAPDHIPQLTYSKFLQFHRTHYAPQKTKVVLYGNIPTEEKLAFIEEHLAHDLATLPKVCADAPAPRLPARKAPKPLVARAGYTPEAGNAKADKGICCVAWALDDKRDPELDLGFQLLEAVLLGNAGSPLSKALLESRIGSEPLASGYDNETKYTTFSVAMRGVKKENFGKFEALILDTLRKIVAEGLDEAQVQSAVAGFQFSNLNITSKYLIDILEDICGSWVYSDDPFAFLRQSEALPKIQEMLAKHPRFFQDLIQKWLLDNPSRVRIELTPDSKLKKRQEDKLKAKLAKRLAGWSDQRIAKAKAFAKKLQEMALRPDTPEALATLPTLTKDDVPKKLAPIPSYDSAFANGLRMRRGDVFDNGISRVNFMADISGMPPHLIPWLSYFFALFRQLGNATASYDKFGAQCAALGVTFSLIGIENAQRVAPGAPLLTAAFALEGLDQNFAAGLELFRQQLDTIVFTERKRIVECLQAQASAATAGLTNRSNLRRSSARASQGVLPLGWLNESTQGFAGYRRLQEVASLNEKQLDDFCGTMQEIATWIRTAPLVAGGFVGSDRAWELSENFASQFPVLAAAQPYSPPEAPADAMPEQLVHRREQLVVPNKVTNCVRLFQAPHRSDPDSPALKVLTGMLGVGCLWDEIRAKGGAYSVGFTYSPNMGSAKLYSADDPNPTNTYQVFDRLHQYVADHNFTDEEVSKAVLNQAGSFFRPDRPAELCSACSLAIFHGRGEAERQAEFDALMSLTPKAVKNAGLRLLDPASARWNDCAIGPQLISNFNQMS